jgi:hypothetical protein
MQISENLHTDTHGEEKEIFLSSLFHSMQPSEVDEHKLLKKVETSVNEVLARRFSVAEKRQIRPYNDRIAFACPFCGDSSRDMKKKRGNIFFNSLNFHCFNGDCDTHLSLYAFLEKFEKLALFSPEELGFLREKNTVSDSHIKQIGKKQEILETMYSDIVTRLAVPRVDLMKKLKLREIRGTRIEKYLEKRLQTRFERFGFDPSKGQIYLFNLTTDGSGVIGMQIKTFSKTTPYITHKATYLHELLGTLTEENREEVSRLDSISKAFGILSLDINKNVTVFEGPFDSYLFPNSVGMCSVKNDFPFDLEGVRYFYDNDDTGREWSLRRIAENRSVFLWKKFLQDSNMMEYYADKRIKDLNDLMILVKRGTVKPKRFSDYFSKEKYDMIYV